MLRTKTQYDTRAYELMQKLNRQPNLTAAYKVLFQWVKTEVITFKIFEQLLNMLQEEYSL